MLSTGCSCVAPPNGRLITSRRGNPAGAGASMGLPSASVNFRGSGRTAVGKVRLAVGSEPTARGNEPDALGNGVEEVLPNVGRPRAAILTRGAG